MFKNIEKFINWKYKPFMRRNPSYWLDNQKLREIWNNTTGPFSSPDPVECFILYAISKNSNGNCLEFGSWKGRSSCFIAQGIKDSNKPNRKLYCVDWFLGDNTGGAGADKKEMMRSINKFDLSNQIEIFDQDMHTVDFYKFDNLDFVFYDSDHSPEPTAKTLNRLHEHLNKKCLIALHDAGCEDTQEAIKRLSKKYKHIITLPVWEGFALCIKINTARIL